MYYTIVSKNQSPLQEHADSSSLSAGHDGPQTECKAMETLPTTLEPALRLTFLGFRMIDQRNNKNMLLHLCFWLRILAGTKGRLYQRMGLQYRNQSTVRLVL